MACADEVRKDLKEAKKVVAKAGADMKRWNKRPASCCRAHDRN